MKLLIALLILGAFAITPVYAKREHKVTICHKGNTIEVDFHALQAHLNHGDYKGECKQEQPCDTPEEPTPPVDVPEEPTPQEEPQTPPTQPETPKKPDLKDVTDGLIKHDGVAILRWKRIEGSNKVEIKYGTDKHDLKHNFKTDDDGKYILTGLETGKTYYFKIRGRNSKGEWSERFKKQL